VSKLSAAHGKHYTLVGPLAGGETGATAIVDPSGRQLVLKWEADPVRQTQRLEGIRLAERLRTEAGWPVPRQRSIAHDGLLLVTQEFMTGGVVTDLTHEFVDDVFELHERRLGLARPGDSSDFASDLIETLTDGGNGYCLHEPLRGFDHRTKRIVERIEEIGRSLRPEDLGGRDVVHWDLHPGNLLQAGGGLVAVVDLDFACVGDAAFDLATLAVASLEIRVDPGVSARLFEPVDALPEARRSAYLAHLLLRILDWPIRKGRNDDVEFWLAQANRLMPEP
jgi:thiamine kinase-like enzyme